MTQKHLSYSAILVLAANTMNGPGITTLPDVAVDAGILLYIVLIVISVRMASFVCKRMVHAMWSSIKNEYYERVDSVDIDVKSSLKEEEPENCNAESSITVQLTELHTNQIQLEHREHYLHKNDPQSKLLSREDDSTLSLGDAEIKSLIDHEHKSEVSHLQPVLERTSIVGQSLEGYGRSTSTMVALTMVASALCLALAQMMLCAAIMDGLFVVVGGKSCALGLPNTNEEGHTSFVYCTIHSSMKPYMNSGAPVSIMSIGWVIATAVSVFLGTKHLDEMMTVQYTFFGCLIVSCMRFTYVLSSMSANFDDLSSSSQSAKSDATDLSWGIGPNPFLTVGPIMFNFAFIVTAPPLSALAKRQSIASDALGMSCVVMGALYAVIGWVGAPVSNAVRNGLIKGGDDTNLLSLILLSGADDGGVSALDLICISAFGISILASIPVYCLLAQQTLVHDAGVAKFPAFVFSNVVPWILVALTYNAAFFEAFVNWSGLLILGYANFSLPLLLDSRLQKVRSEKAVLDDIDLDGSLSKDRRSSSEDIHQSTKITNVFFSLVTASISSVIAISLMPIPSLTVTALVFVVMIFATLLWPDASLDF